MRGYNKIILMGNLVRDPEIKYTSDNKAVASVAVAVNRTYKDASGQSQEEVTYFPIIAWGYLAEFCQNYCHKGDGVLVEGRVVIRSYETKSGEKRQVTEVAAGGIQFVGTNPRPQAQRETSSYVQNRQQSQQMQPMQNKKNRYTAQELAEKAPVEEFDLPF